MGGRLGGLAGAEQEGVEGLVKRIPARQATVFGKVAAGVFHEFIQEFHLQTVTF
ncbi:MAG: hypothetical protein ACD_75C00633G0002 [uncultured bacterium]|nr:MAG: hypothetical protein ACD_75C00633G0002 [uncultured bacterium]